jgi:hypothetical protein
MISMAPTRVLCALQAHGYRADLGPQSHTFRAAKRKLDPTRPGTSKAAPAGFSDCAAELSAD